MKEARDWPTERCAAWVSVFQCFSDVSACLSAVDSNSFRAIVSHNSICSAIRRTWFATLQ